MNMERGELCHDQCMVLLLEGRMQDIGTVKPNTRGAIYTGFGLKSGVWRLHHMEFMLGKGDKSKMIFFEFKVRRS